MQWMVRCTVGTGENYVAMTRTREDESVRGLVREGTGTTVHDERASSLWAARLGTVEPVPDGLDLRGMNPSRRFSREYALDRTVYSWDR